MFSSFSGGNKENPRNHLRKRIVEHLRRRIAELSNNLLKKEYLFFIFWGNAKEVRKESGSGVVAILMNNNI